jgi:hypothetical protein
MMRRRFWVIAAGVPLLLLAGETAYWRVAAERLRAGYGAWLAAQTAQGWEIASGSVSTGGWPLAATLTVPNLTFRHAGPTVPGDVNVASAGVALSVSLYDPTALRVLLTGPTHVRAGDSPDVIVTGDEIRVDVPLVQSDSPAVMLFGKGVRLEPATGAWHVTVGLLSANAMVESGASVGGSRPAATFSMSAEAIALPGGVKWPLGTNISSLSMDGRLNGRLPPARDITGWTEAWRDGGGSLDITRLAMGWGPLGLTASATLKLDEQLQPMGSGNGRIVGYAETLDRLAAGGAMTRSAATAAKAVLSLMAATSDTEAPSSVEVPLTLRHRTLSIGQIPLLRLPDVDWPARP